MRSTSSDAVHRYFAGLTEYAFVSRLGLADPSLVDYVAELLTRFVRSDAVYRIQDPSGRRLSGVARMMAEADQRIGEARRLVHRHIGDFALFWAGLYPEALELSQGAPRGEEFLDYCSHGKRAYLIASTIPAADETENDVLLRLSTEFEACVYGLGEVRREWERRDPAAGSGPVLLN